MERDFLTAGKIECATLLRLVERTNEIAHWVRRYTFTIVTLKESESRINHFRTKYLHAASLPHALFNESN